MSNPVSPLLLPPLVQPTEDPKSLQRAILALINALHAENDRLNDLIVQTSATDLVTVRPAAKPMSWMGTYVASQEYLAGDVVYNSPYLVVANKTTTATADPTHADWDFLANSTV